MIPTVNNYKLVGKYDKEPPFLSKLKEIQGFQVYSSSYATDLYVVFDHKENFYYAFQGTGESTNLDLDLGWNIRIYLIGTLK